MVDKPNRVFVNGVCEICGNPCGSLYLDLGVWKCEGCCNPHYLPNNRLQSTTTTMGGILE